MAVDREEAAYEIEKDENYRQIHALAIKKYPFLDVDDADKMLFVITDWLRGERA
jgi:hypothetical protein